MLPDPLSLGYFLALGFALGMVFSAVLVAAFTVREW